MFFPHCRNLWTSHWLFQCMLCHYITGRYLAHPCLKPHRLNYLTDSNVSGSFADTVTWAIIGLQVHSWNPIKVWVMSRMFCYIIWILFSWSVYFRLFWASKWKENASSIQFQSQVNSGQIFTNASILSY